MQKPTFRSHRRHTCGAGRCLCRRHRRRQRWQVDSRWRNRLLANCQQDIGRHLLGFQAEARLQAAVDAVPRLAQPAERAARGLQLLSSCASAQADAGSDRGEAVLVEQAPLVVGRKSVEGVGWSMFKSAVAPLWGPCLIRISLLLLPGFHPCPHLASQ